MKRYTFNVELEMEAANEFSAKEKLTFVISNLREMCNYAPYSIHLKADEDSCKEVKK